MLSKNYIVKKALKGTYIRGSHSNCQSKKSKKWDCERALKATYIRLEYERCYQKVRIVKKHWREHILEAAKNFVTKKQDCERALKGTYIRNS